METTDVIVVGGGVIGLAIAWRATQAGLSVTVCDPEPGRGASWAAAGMLAPVTEASMAESPLTALGLASVDLWPDFAAELTESSGIDVGLRDEGTVMVAFDDDDRRALDELAAVHVALGLKSEKLSSQECRSLEPRLSPRIRAGLRVAHDWQVDNRSVVAALLEAGRRAGAVLRTASVRRLHGDDAGVHAVELDDGDVLAAGTVVVAAGAWSGGLPGLPEAARAPVRPVKGEILRLQGDPASPVVEGTVRAGVAGRAVYLVPRRDGGLVVGASVQEAGFDAGVRAGAVYELLQAAVAVVPDVAELALIETLARLRPATPDNAPVLGPTPVPGVVLATGHYRNGILLTPVTAQAITAVLRGKGLPSVARPFTVERFS